MPSSLQHMRLALLLLLSVSFAAQAAEVTPESFLATHNAQAVRLNQTAMSVLLQGGVLLLFDAVLWGLNWRLNSQLTARLVPAPNGVGLMLTWP